MKLVGGIEKFFGAEGPRMKHARKRELGYFSVGPFQDRPFHAIFHSSEVSNTVPISCAERLLHLDDTPVRLSPVTSNIGMSATTATVTAPAPAGIRKNGECVANRPNGLRKGHTSD